MAPKQSSHLERIVSFIQLLIGIRLARKERDRTVISEVPVESETQRKSGDEAKMSDKQTHKRKESKEDDEFELDVAR